MSRSTKGEDRYSKEYNQTLESLGAEKFYSLTNEEQFAEVQLTYMAQLLIEIYLHNNYKKSEDTKWFLSLY